MNLYADKKEKNEKTIKWIIIKLDVLKNKKLYYKTCNDKNNKNLNINL